MTDISVIVPTYNSSLFISKTLKSIINQTLKPYEVIIIDDGSTDNTKEKILSIISQNKNINIKLISGLHAGPGSARNIGIKSAKSKWIAFLDSDDLWFKEKLKIVSKSIKENVDYTFFCHNEKTFQFGKPAIVLDYSKKYNPKKKLSKQLYKNNLFSTSAVVCLRDDLIKVGGFDENLSSAQDYDLWLKMSQHIKPFFIKKVLGVYTIRDGNITSTNHFKKLINIMTIMIRHKSKGNMFLFFIKISFYFILVPLVLSLKKIIYRFKI